MRLAFGMILVAVSGCSEQSSPSGAANLALPQVYPPVRAATPSALILDTQYGDLGSPILIEDAALSSDAGLLVTDAGIPDAVAPTSSLDASGGLSTEAGTASASPDGGSVTYADADVILPGVDAAGLPADAGVPAPGADGGEPTIADAASPTSSSMPAPPPPPGGSMSPPVGSVAPPPPPGGTSSIPVMPSGPLMPPPPPGGTSGMQPGAINLATAIQERFYSAGPTSLLRIVKELDDRVATLDTNPSKHNCLTAEPTSSTYALPGGQTFGVKLQCLQTSGNTWIAFGFDKAASADGGSVVSGDGNDFYFVEGQDSGMGGAYRVEGSTGNLEAWITVANENAPNNSQVILHLLTNKRLGTLELSLAGSGVGFCSAHLKTNANFLFVSGKTNGAAPPGSALPEGTQYCDAARFGCFAATDLASEADSASCADLSAASFALTTELDASTDTNANVTPATLYNIFNRAPVGIAEL